jgi:hypothetical protein
MCLQYVLAAYLCAPHLLQATHPQVCEVLGRHPIYAPLMPSAGDKEVWQQTVMPPTGCLTGAACRSACQRNA